MSRRFIVQERGARRFVVVDRERLDDHGDYVVTDGTCLTRRMAEQLAEQFERRAAQEGRAA